MSPIPEDCDPVTSRESDTGPPKGYDKYLWIDPPLFWTRLVA